MPDQRTGPMTSAELIKKYGRSFKAGDIIFQESQPGDYMYIIMEGVVKISKTIKGETQDLNNLDKGEFFGEAAITGQKPRSATAIAQTDCLLLAIDRNSFYEMLSVGQDIIVNIVNRLAERLRQANKKITELISKEKEGVE